LFRAFGNGDAPHTKDKRSLLKARAVTTIADEFTSKSREKNSDMHLVRLFLFSGEPGANPDICA
jgi:hypothetical protein